MLRTIDVVRGKSGHRVGRQAQMIPMSRCMVDQRPALVFSGSRLRGM